MSSLDEKNNTIQVLGPDPEKMACSNCKWAVNGATKCNCLKYVEKPHDVYYENAKCPKFASLKGFKDFKKEEQK